MDILLIVLLNDAILILAAYLFLRVLVGKLPGTLDFVKENIKISLEQWLNSQPGQKALYSIGGLIGHGALAGSGIQKTSGKFKLENFIAELASSWIQQNVKKPNFGSGDMSKPVPNPQKPGLGSA